MAHGIPVSVIELPAFIAAVGRLMDVHDHQRLIDFLAHNPRAGDVIPGGGGVRKLRWALPGRGKSGGARIVYYFHSDSIPLFALTAYAKNERADISQGDRNDFHRLSVRLVEIYGRRKVR